MEGSPSKGGIYSEPQPREKRIYVREGYFHYDTSRSDKSYLIGSKCKVCGYVSFPKRRVCPACIKENTMEEVPLSRSGKIDTYSVVHVSLPGFSAPYMLARVELPEGPRVTSLITGCEAREGAIDIGTEVELVIGKITEDKEGNDIIGYMFRPLRTGEGRM